jgi:hypothetical protein
MVLSVEGPHAAWADEEMIDVGAARANRHCVKYVLSVHCDRSVRTLL